MFTLFFYKNIPFYKNIGVDFKDILRRTTALGWDFENIILCVFYAKRMQGLALFIKWASRGFSVTFAAYEFNRDEADVVNSMAGNDTG